MTTGQSATTPHPNNTVVHNGALTSNNASNSVGIRMVGGNTGSVTSTGTISLLEEYTITDTDSDGDLDGDYAAGTGRIGIFLQGGPLFNGNLVTTNGAITVEGNDLCRHPS